MNIVGNKYGKLFVLEKTKEKAKNNREAMYKCKCDCGKIIKVRGSNLKTGNTQSCGCLKYELSYRNKNIRIYNIYCNMRQRCYSSKNKAYKDYGGRGIKICDEWLNNYLSFYNWSINNGYKDNFEIDRINVNGNYEPNNCRWVTRIVQANNKRITRKITYRGITKSMAEWAKELHMSQAKLKYRLDNWDIEKAFDK